MDKNPLIVLVGGSGFVGSALCNQLEKAGYRVRVLTRKASRCRHLRVLPQLEVLETSDWSPDGLSEAFNDADAVINLVGILNESRRCTFRAAHVDLVRDILKACEISGVKRFLHMSALHADPDGPSAYLRSKGQAEQYLNTFAAPKVNITMFCPSVIFGPGDSFLNRFADLLKFAPAFPLACPKARFAPVYVYDVVDSFVNAIEDESSYGKRIFLCGPNTYTLKELVEYVAKVRGYKRWIIGLGPLPSRLQAMVLQYVPGKPFTMDNYRSLSIDSVCPDGPTCETSLEAMAEKVLLG